MYLLCPPWSHPSLPNNNEWLRRVGAQSGQSLGSCPTAGHKMAAQGLLNEKVSEHPSASYPTPWMRMLKTETSYDSLGVCEAEAEPRLPDVQPEQRGTQHHRKKQDIDGFQISSETQIPPRCLPHPVFGAKLVSACAWLAPSHPFKNPCLGHPSSLPQHAQ